MNKPKWLFNQFTSTYGISRELGKGLNAKIFIGDQSMLSFVHIAPNSEGKIHSHPEEQWGVLLEGECTRIQDGQKVKVKKGDFWHTPSGVTHGIRTGDKSAVILDIFSPPRSEYRKKGEGFGDVD